MIILNVNYNHMFMHAARKRAAIVWNQPGKNKSSAGDVEADSKKEKETSSRSKRDDKKPVERSAAHDDKKEDRKLKEDKG